MVNHIFISFKFFSIISNAVYRLNYLDSVQAFSENFTGLELEDGGGRGTSGI